MSNQPSIILSWFPYASRKLKFQIKKQINKKQSYINWVDHGAKGYIRFGVKIALYNFHS